MPANKIQIFLITFLAYTSIHSLRTTYSFSKQYLAKYIMAEGGKQIIGYVDAMLLAMLGLGHFLHALTPVKYPVKTLWIGTLFCALDYIMIPFLIQMQYFNQHYHKLIILIMLMSINGYLQSYTWPNLLMVIQQYYDEKKQSIALGIWATSANIGNIVGYFMCQIVVTQYGFGWQMGMYIAGGIVLVNALILSVRVKQIQHHSSHKSNSSSSVLDKQMNKHLSISHVFKDITIVSITLAFSLIKSVIYGIMLWLPLYFHSVGLEEYKTYIPICYDINCVIGSILLGWVFKRTTMKGTVLAPLMLILVFLFLGLRYMQLTYIGYFVLVGGVGACLGGTFNTMAGLVTMQLTKVVPKQYKNQCLGFFSALTMSVANITTAVTQILIGYIAKKQQSTIFLLFMGYSLAALFCLLIVSFNEYQQYCIHLNAKSQEQEYQVFSTWFNKKTIKEIMDKMEHYKTN